MRTKTKKPSPTPELLEGRLMLTVKEYAALVGMPAPTAYRYCTIGAIPATRIGRSLRIPVAAVLEQLKAAGPAA